MNPDQPQWYYVGNGTFRYWDGLIWTDEYRDGDDPAEPVEEYSGPKHLSQERRRVRQWLVGIAVVLTLALAAVAVLVC